MNQTVEYCKYKFYSEFDTKEILNKIKYSIDSDTKIISCEMGYALNKILFSEPCTYWNKSVCMQVYNLLQNLSNSSNGKVEIDETVFEYFLMGYNSYLQIAEIIMDLRNFNINQETKTHLYRLPTYTTILESCLSNFLRVIAITTGKTINKDYTAQNTLGKLITVIEANGYTEISKIVNVNLRNAINHGKISVKRDLTGYILNFYYVEKHVSKCVELSIYEFDRIIDSTFDTVSGVLLGILLFINNNTKLLKIDSNKNEYLSFSLLAMKLSIPSVYCSSISDIRNNKQLNIELEIQNTDRGYISQIATCMAILVYDYYKEYDQYMFSFSNPRMCTGWIRYTKEEINDMYTGKKSFDTVLKSVIERSDHIIFDASSELIDLNEVKYFTFPNYSNNKYKINNIQDSSNEDRKRLKANLYIGDIEKKEDILDIINSAIEWLKKIKNPPSPIMKQKHGIIEADCLYINVYKNDHRTNKELLPSNENFVCFVDYNRIEKTTLKNGGLPEVIWKRLYHEEVQECNIAWRESCYIRSHSSKIGRNTLCSCGSGKKYKKCCGKVS